ncbi:peptidylprolyl isomerase [Aureispira anguillae]|uniref:Peptidylprolyl isomerase n=1 Tax=Aureispira anguillae TaxID=2864201 RepID=A0A915YJB5_9BACT|nr:peptidylprolyl isomerase [Aureispira anguillae]BDS14248.1 peptidylprolyl isomerase [Aureispira anguillae]
MKKIWIPVILWALCHSLTFAQRQQIDKVIGVVGNHIILQSDVEAQLKSLKSQSQGVDLPEDARWLVFDQLLANALMLAEAEQDSILVGDMEVQAQLDARVTQILAYMNNDPQKFKEFYDMTPSEMKDFMRDQMKDQLVQQKMQQQIMSSITITPKEVKDFFNGIPSDSLPYFNSEVELAEIVIKPKINPIEDARARKLARNLMLQIVEDSVDFEVLAKKYSDDRASAALGGNLGVQARGTLVPEFEAMAYQLKPGEVSEVVKTEFGYHVIQLINRLGNTINTKHILIRPDITTEDREGAYQELDSIRNLILADSINFAQGIALYSEEDFSKTRAGRIMNPMTGEPYFELGDLEPSIYFAIDGMKEGEVTKVIEYETRTGDKQFRIVKLLTRTEPHVANLKDDYSKIRKAALESKKGRFIIDWIDRKIADNYIEIKLENLGEQLTEAKACEALKKWFDANSVRP